MLTQTNPLFLLYAVIVAQFGHLLFVLLRRPDGKPLWRYCMIVLAVSLTLMVAEFMLTWSGYLVELPWLMGISFALPFLLGPAVVGSLYFFDGRSWRWEHLLHLLPFVVALSWNLPFLLSGQDVKSDIYETAIVTETYFHEWVYIKTQRGLPIAPRPFIPRTETTTWLMILTCRWVQHSPQFAGA